MAQITGTNGNDNSILGGKDLIGNDFEDDTILGLAGDDRLFDSHDSTTAGNDILDGGAGNDFLSAGAGNDILDGGIGNDFLAADAGNDTLDGGTDDDFMRGGIGNDTYIVDSSGDEVQEFDNQGIDTVKSSISFSLPDNVENLTLTGTSDSDGNGNDLSNTIIGNAGDNRLNGADGNDTLKGGGGNDTLSGDVGNNLLDGGTGSNNTVDEDAKTNGDEDANFKLTPTTLNFGSNVDHLINIQAAHLVAGDGDNTMDASAFKGSVNLNGLFGDDRLIGGVAKDILSGGESDDRLTGGAGDDSFFGGQDNDQVIEAGNVNFTLTNTSLKGNGNDTLDSIEFAELRGGSGNNTLDTTKFDKGNVTLIGEAGNDTLKTGKGNDTLRGDAGDDIMQGGDGGDSYFVDSSKDKVIEASNTGGVDFVQSSASFTLGDNVENLTLFGSSDINGTGNGQANIIKGDGNNNTLKGLDGKDTLTGGLGNDILVGGTGSDTLTGNGGNDRFTFDTGAAFNNATMGLDSVQDFKNFGLEDDQIVLDKTTFTALKSGAGNGFSVGSEFAAVGSSSAAATSSALIAYDSSSGGLFFNQNGIVDGFGTGGQFATISGHPPLGAVDFVIQA